MTTNALNSFRRTWQEIGGMLLLASIALTCVAAVNQKVEKQLDTNATRITQTSFAEDTLPAPKEPTPPIMVMISCPVDGIFQTGNTPGGPALVKVGTSVKPNTAVGSVQPENATLMPILARVTGTIKEILVKDQDMVMAGQALMKIEPLQMPKAPEE